MSRNKIVKTVENKYIEFYCDICGKKLNWELQCSVARCEICKKDLCEKCIGHEDETGSDYRIVWCENCWYIGEKYRIEIKKHENKIRDLYDEWEKESISYRKHLIRWEKN